MTAPHTHAHLFTEPRLADPDAFYEALIDMHRGLSAEASELVNAKLILLLANHIGDAEVLHEAFALARQGIAPGQDSPAVENKTNQET